MLANILQNDYNSVPIEAPGRGCHHPGHGTESEVSMQDYPTAARALDQAYAQEVVGYAYWRERVHVQANGCWVWTGPKTAKGYGRVSLQARPRLMAHRVSYAAHVESLTPGLELHHTCRNTSCVNPEHLLALTRKAHRRIDDVDPAPTETHCRNGHPYNAENVYHDPRGRKNCRVCNREAQRRCAARRKARLP